MKAQANTELAQRSEEILQKRSSLDLANAAIDFRAVMAACAFEHARTMINTTTLGVIGPEINPAQSGK